MLTEAAPISAEHMRLVLDVSALLALTDDLNMLLTRIAEAATKLIEAERASIFLHDSKTNQLWTKVALGTREIRVPSNAGIVGHVFQSNQTLLVPEPYSDPRFNRDVDKKSGFVTRNLLTVPVKNTQRKPIGALQVVNRIGGPFSETDVGVIELLADQAGVAILRFYLQQEAVKSAEMRHEMDLAHKVQAAMIPQNPPKIAGISSVGWTLPASVTGGDVYDLWESPDGRLGIFLGDASGHGIAPAIVVSQCRTLLRAMEEINSDPAWLLQSVNRRLAADLEPGRFVTAFAGNLSRDGELRWTSAGHGPMFLRRSPGDPIAVIEPVGPPVGIMPELMLDETTPILLAPGGEFIVMSDGIFESRNPAGDLFEVERVIQLLDEHRDRPPSDQLAAIKRAMIEWQGKEEPIDDQTVVMVKRE